MTAPRRLPTLLAALCLLVPPLAEAAKPAAPVPQNRMVIQVNEDDEKKWNAILSNVHNVQADLGKDKVRIEVVAYGAGIGMLKADSLVANRVEDALADGVSFVACGNTMNALKIGKDDMIQGIGYAKAGFVRIMERQQQGWAYIRP